MWNKEKYHNDEKYREERLKEKRKYYGKTAAYKPSRYTLKEIEMVLRHDIPDTELSKLIHHSVESIQMKRHRLKKYS